MRWLRLPAIFRSGADITNNPCTYCNKCLLHVIEDPLGCYNQDCYDSYAELVETSSRTCSGKSQAQVLFLFEASAERLKRTLFSVSCDLPLTDPFSILHQML
jgi:hypothetical protein